jgi:P4 family phage/plasmid primase-like protien
MKTSSSNSNTFTSKRLDDFLKHYRAEKGSTITNTRIGSKDLNIFGGSYNIPHDKYNEFLNIYYESVFENKNEEYLTEKQLINDGPLLVDIDLRYDSNIKTRQHSNEHIVDIITLYLNKFEEIYILDNQVGFNIYVLQKPEVNILDDKTKDGIHLIFTLKMSKGEQCLLRKKIINDIESIFENIPIINSFEDVFDEGVTKGFVNWQLFGSKKPGNKDYKLTNFYEVKYDDEDGFNIKENNVLKINIQDHIHLMSARYSEHNKLQVKDNVYILDAIEKENNELNNKNKSNKPVILNNNIDLDLYDFSKITNMAQLDNLIEIFIDSIIQNDYELKEIHDFVLILPENYYGEGSYSKWIRVGWALKNTNEKLFLTWMKFSSKSNSFNFADIPDFYNLWNSFEIKNSDGLTSRSIMYWAKTDNLKEYQNIRQETVSFYIDQTLESIIRKDKVGEYDLAIVLYQLFKDKFVCVSVKNNQWYEYKNDKWNEVDSGNSLRLHISRKMHDIYVKKTNELIQTITKMENNDQNTEALKVRSCKLGDISILLKTTSWKNNIMKEARDLFYDNEFMDKLDSNPYLLSFNNCVIDFKNKLSRKGKPDDYISKSTKIDYIPYNKLKGPIPLNKSLNYESVIDEINQFIKELFPNEELKNYMWEHLASVLIGTNENQTFNIYNGSGRNGKSKLVELMTKCLGDYKATVPITLITQKRNGIGSTSSEIVQLQGIRYAVMQEPSKGDKINEGIMKEITGGDPIQGRALFKDTVTFIPQFKLVVCTNVLFDINTNDDGTWRRIRLCEFMSKFVSDPYNNEEKFPKANYPYQYKVDTKIDEKFDIWAPVLMSMLVNTAFETQGHVKDAKIVLSVSDKYRENQDYLTEFAKDKIIKKRDGKIKKTEILEEFKNWYIMNYGRNNLPNGKEITDYMDKMYGKASRGKWLNVEINYDDSDGESDNEED